MKPVTLVLGATGRVGSRVAQELIEAGHHVRAATRDPLAAARSIHALSSPPREVAGGSRRSDLGARLRDEPARALAVAASSSHERNERNPPPRDLGGAQRSDLGAHWRDAGQVDWVKFDLEEPGTFADALEGVQRVLLVARPGDEQPDRAAAPLIAAMRAAGVEHVVNLTALGVERRPDFGLRRLELLLEDSGLAFTHLRPGFFFQLFTAPPLYARICKERAIRVPADAAKLAFIDVRDVAAVAAAVLRSTEHRKRAYSLTGPSLVDHSEIASALSEYSRTLLHYQPVSEDEAATQLAADGLPPAWVQRVLGFYRIVRSGQASLVTQDVREILGRDAIDLQTFARDHAHCFDAAHSS